jgi:HAMP domain-containing protein
VTYWHLSREIEKTSLQTLEKYVRERSLREREIFKLASDNHYLLRKDLVDVFSKIEKSNSDPVQEFNALVKKDPDGALRSPRSKVGERKDVDIWVAKNARNDALFRRKVVAFSKVLLKYAPSFHVRFTDTYIALAENANIVYWPEFPDWSAGTPANYDFSSYELYQIGKKQLNPERKTRWSGVYFDDAIGKWMVSASTPFDDSRGFFAGVIGHDLMIDDLIKRTTNEGLKGTYNILISGEGRLMAHPKKMDAIIQAKGRLTVDNLGDPELRAIFKEVKNSTRADFNERIIDQSDYDQFIAVSYLPETDWYFVTIYPKLLVRNMANSAATFIILVGLVSLLVDLVLLYFIFRRKVAEPLEQFILATEELEQGQNTSNLPIHRKDEIGKLSRSFDAMANRIRETRNSLNEQIDQRTRELASIQVKAKGADQALHMVDEIIKSVNQSLVELDTSLRKTGDKEALAILQGLQRKVFTIEEALSENLK